MASYRVEVTKAARREILDLPGNMRQLIFREIQSFENDARPYSSKGMKSTMSFKIPKDVELRSINTMIKVNCWRICKPLTDDVMASHAIKLKKNTALPAPVSETQVSLQSIDNC